ncbi:RNA polymerase sigma factor [Candidatus Latescibacterota bacterium]
MEKINEHHLLKRCRDGDLKSYNTLYNRYKDRIYSISVRMLGNIHDAEDATQEIFIKIFKSIGEFRGDSALFTWIYRITMNTCVEFLRKKEKYKKEDPLDEMEYRPELSYETEDSGSFNRIVEQEIKKLPEGYRKVFILYAVEGFKHKEITEILNISEGTSKSQYFRAKIQLRKQLLPYLEVLKNEL